MKATLSEIDHLYRVYHDRPVFYGDLHNHAATGGTSDGGRNLDHWKGALEALGMNFAAILDHRQVRHMYLPQWEDTVFIGGTEPGTRIVDSEAEVAKLHYNMVFSSPKPLEDLLSTFDEFEFTGGCEGHFTYPTFTTRRFCQLIDAVKERGGFFVLPHPKQIMSSQNPLDYWFRDETGIEVFYGDLRNEDTAANYKLWTQLLALGKRVWACAGEDGHKCASDRALTTVYAEEGTSQAYLDRFRVGDFVCGSVGIRMCVGSTSMGGQCSFTDQRLILSVANFHRSVRNPEHTYRLELINENGVILTQRFSCEKPLFLSMEAKPCRFYRAEVFDDTQNLRIAIGNPIWNL